MQEVLKFPSCTVISNAFFDFIKRGYFNFFISFAESHNTFLIVSFEEQNFKDVVIHIPKLQFDSINFINLSLEDISLDGEILLLDSVKKSNVICLIPKGFKPHFILKDVESRFNAAFLMNFEDSPDLNFAHIGRDFLLKNGIHVELEVLEKMLLHVERDVKSFTIFIEELRLFVETYKVKVKKHHFKQILHEYEKRRNKTHL